jgi:hypothetical protein
MGKEAIIEDFFGEGDPESFEPETDDPEDIEETLHETGAVADSPEGREWSLQAQPSQGSLEVDDRYLDKT